MITAFRSRATAAEKSNFIFSVITTLASTLEISCGMGGGLKVSSILHEHWHLTPHVYRRQVMQGVGWASAVRSEACRRTT